MSRVLITPFVNLTLGNSSYLVGSPESGQAVVIDPERDVEKYIKAAQEQGLEIVYGLETHLHADFISGVHELGAAVRKRNPAASYQVGASAAGDSRFAYRALADGDRIVLGPLELRVLATPGHSREHISFLAYKDGGPQPLALFSGGSLIVGGTGRPDLHGAAETEPLARLLFDTIQNKLAKLPDELEVFPTHGAGSFCNTTTGAERTTTIGKERLTNPFFALTDEEDFVQAATTGLGSFPEYYKRLPDVNRAGPAVLGSVPKLPALSPSELQSQVEGGAIVLDVRDPERFLAGHIPNAYGIPVFSPLSTWAGWVVPPDVPILLVADAPGELNEAVLQLFRVGYDELRGFLDGGLAAWQEAGLPLSHVENVNARELKGWLETGQAPSILDVRLRREWNGGHLPGACHLEVGLLQYASREQIGARQDPILVHCKVGTRSTVAVSLLERKGFTNLLALDEGIEAWKQAGYELVQDGSELN